MRSAPSESLLSSIYEAAVQPEGWQPLLLEVSDRLAGAAVLADARTDPRGLPVILHTARFDTSRFVPAIAELAEDGANPLLDHIRTGAQIGRYFDRRETISDAAFERTPVADIVLFPQDLYEIGATALERRSDFLSLLAVARPRSGGQFAAEERRYLDILAPHLSRALSLAARLQTTAFSRFTLEALLDGFPEAVFAVDGSGRQLGRNAAAEKLLSRGSPFDFRDGTLCLPDDRQQRSFSSHLQIGSGRFVDQPEAGILLAGQALNEIHRITIWPAHLPSTPLTKGQQVFLVMARPLMEIDAPRGGGGSGSGMLPALLRDGFGLTPSEVRLAILLARLGTLEEALADLGISRNTAKTHLRHIFTKTGTRNQIELVQLVTAIVTN